MSVKQDLSKLQSYSDELGLDLTKPEDRFKWFLASILFAKRISAETAKETYLYFEQEELTSPNAILEAGWDRLVEVLDSGGYIRYDFSTATKLLGIVKTLKERYGSLERLHAESSSPSDLEKRLQEFKGVKEKRFNFIEGYCDCFSRSKSFSAPRFPFLIYDCN
jgi:endonuclease III